MILLCDRGQLPNARYVHAYNLKIRMTYTLFYSEPAASSMRFIDCNDDVDRKITFILKLFVYVATENNVNVITKI